MMQAVVLAAGRGTRLGHLTTRRSKAMLPVAGQPLVGRVMEQLWAAGLRRFVVVGGVDDRELADFAREQESRLFSDKSDRRDNARGIAYAVQSQRRGMAHAVACAAPLIDGPFLVNACDNLVASDFVAEMLACLAETGADGVLALLHMAPERLQHSAAVELTASGRVRQIVEKPPPGSTDTDAGSIALYAFSPRLLDHLDVPVSPRGEQELQSAIQALIDAGGKVRALFAPGRQTVTRPTDLLDLNLHYLDQGGYLQLPGSLPSDVALTPPLYIEGGVEVGEACVIGPRVYLEAGCRVGAGVFLRDAVVLRGAVVPDGAKVVRDVW